MRTHTPPGGEPPNLADDNEPTGEDLLSHTVPVRWLLAAIGAVLVASVGGTWKVATVVYSNESEASPQPHAAQERTEASDPEPDERNAVAQLDLPSVGARPATEVDGTQVLRKRISALESERSDLLKQLAEREHNSLAPDSELFGLLQQLKSESEEERIEAVHGLFIIRDRRALASLLSHYDERPEERYFYIGSWLEMIWALNPAQALEFAARVYSSGTESDVGDLEINLRYLDLDEVEDSAPLKAAFESLEAVALQHESALRRTRVKKLLKRLNAGRS